MEVAGATEKVANAIIKRSSCFEIQYDVPISTFDHSVENFNAIMDVISELSGETKIESFEASEIERFKAMIIFLREWKPFFFCEWMPSHYKSKMINFNYHTESTEEKRVINGIELPHFSSAAVPKVTEELPCTSSAFDKNDFVLHVGGYVWAMEWCPRLHDNSGDVKCEYLAIAAHPNDSKYHKIGERLSGRGFIQIWCFLHLSDKEEWLDLGVQPCRGEGNKKVNVGSCVPKPRGRPKKTDVPIASNGASNSGCMEVSLARSSLQILGTSTECYVSGEFYGMKEPNKSYSVGNLNGYVEAYDCCDNLIEGTRKRRGRPRKIPIAEVPKPRGRLGQQPIPNSNGHSVVQGASDMNVCGDILPCGALIQKGCSHFHAHDSEASVLLNHVGDCQEIIAVTEGSFQDKSSISEGIALPRLVFSFAHNGKVTWDMKWRPPDTVDSNGKYSLGYLAVVLGDGSLEVWEVPMHSLVKQLYVSRHTEGTDPRFLKLHPVFRCSMIKSGIRQSIPLTLEWCPSVSRDLILVGCHDGTVALLKFSPQFPSQDTKPLLCFTADTVPIRSLAWAPEDSDTECSNLMVTAGHEGLKFWDLRDPYRPLWEFSPVQRAVLGVDWLKDPRCIVIAYEDGMMRTLSLTRIANDTPVTGEPAARTGHHGVHGQSCSMFAIWSIQVSRSTDLAAYCSSDGCIRYFQLTAEFVDKDASRHRKPHFLCGSFVDEGQALGVNTPLPNTPLPKQPFVSKVGDEARPTDSSMPALWWHRDGEMSKNGGEKKSMNEGRQFASFPSKSVAVHKVRWNMNKGSERWLCYGGASGVVRCQIISP